MRSEQRQFSKSLEPYLTEIITMVHEAGTIKGWGKKYNLLLDAHKKLSSLIHKSKGKDKHQLEAYSAVIDEVISKEIWPELRK